MSSISPATWESFIVSPSAECAFPVVLLLAPCLESGNRFLIDGVDIIIHWVIMELWRGQIRFRFVYGAHKQQFLRPWNSSLCKSSPFKPLKPLQLNLVFMTIEKHFFLRQYSEFQVPLDFLFTRRVWQRTKPSFLCLPHNFLPPAPFPVALSISLLRLLDWSMRGHCNCIR